MGIDDYPWGDRNAQRIDSTKPFKSRIDVTDEMLRSIRMAAVVDCPACKGEGLKLMGNGDRTLCRCVTL